MRRESETTHGKYQEYLVETVSWLNTYVYILSILVLYTVLFHCCLFILLSAPGGDGNVMSSTEELRIKLTNRIKTGCVSWSTPSSQFVNGPAASHPVKISNRSTEASSLCELRLKMSFTGSYKSQAWTNAQADLGCSLVAPPV